MEVFSFINHASIRVEYGGLTCITDPWYVSNAFGSWVQTPSPTASDVLDIVDSGENVGIIISHGHDDHLDDWFINRHLKDKIFFSSKFATPGLENRLSKGLGVDTRPIGDGERFGDFQINQHVNPNFTNYDAVVTIATPEFLIIHANDNWHKWPPAMLDSIKNICAGYNDDSIFLLIQFGIADCFPVNYVGVEDDAASNIVRQRFSAYLEATEENMNQLGLSCMYYYANQSSFDYREVDLDGFSVYELGQQFLADKGLASRQLLPGMSIHQGHEVVQSRECGPSIFEFRLRALENFINKGYEAQCDSGRYVRVRFCTTEDIPSPSDINYIASREVWSRILVGELTLEAIIIGGIGSIKKPDINIRDHHMFVSKRAYVAQNMINSKGLSFFREFSD